MSIMAQADLELKKDKFVPLEPFVHQVGGHSSMMKFDEVSVCKPLIPREHRFYEDLPSEMRPFIPEYRGIVYVSFREDDEGVHLIAHPDKRALEHHSSSGSDDSEEDVATSHQRRSRRLSCVESVDKTPHRVRLRSGKVELVDTRTEGIFEADDMPEQSIGSGANPWSLYCHQLQLSKMKESTTSTKLHEFIVLENVAYRYMYPCILDLKMGTRQHGDDVPTEKRNRHIAKVEKSTSKTLGLRVCGMQVYQRNSGRFICRNKYYGLKLSEEGVKGELANFIHNGQHLKGELLEPLIQKLHRLYKVIEKQQSFRYYSSSLLLMYDGGEDATSVDEQLQTNTSMVEGEKCPKGEPPTRKRSLNSSRNQRPGKVDVRMIDFAHTTHSGFSGDRVRTGPDRGYLFGIKNLIRLLEEIRDTCIPDDSFKKEVGDFSQDSNLVASSTCA